MTFGILQRYVMGEVLRAFALAVLTMTIIFVLFMVMAEATKMGLSPRDILNLVPYVVPGTLPYTVPVSMLFAVTVVFGRLASDNEVIAVKTAGLSAMAVLWPAVLMGGGLSLGLLYLTQQTIPRCNNRARLVVFKNFEEAFYKLLKMEREFNNPGWPVMIKVRDVDTETKTMDHPTFKHRNPKDPNPNAVDTVIQARSAVIKFDMEHGLARVYLEDAEISGGGHRDDVFMIDKRRFDIDIPDKNNQGAEKKVQEWTTTELVAEQAKFRLLIARERKRQAVAAAFLIAGGRVDLVKWTEVQTAFIDYGYWAKRISEFETEKQLRVAQSFGSLMFVLLGAPVGILFARRDFLSAFISCFVPIILVYYPVMLLGVNLGKEDVVNPVYALWGGNVLIGVLAGFTLKPVMKH